MDHLFMQKIKKINVIIDLERKKRITAVRYHRDVSRGVSLPVNWNGIPNSYPKLIKNKKPSK